MKLGSKLTRTKETGAQGALWPKRIRLILLSFTVLWILAVSSGLWVLWGYENTPGVSARPPAVWPVDSRIQHSTHHATLVMLIHPHCPCTRASIGELASLMTHTEGRLTAYVLFLKPAGFPDDWEKTDLWHSAAGIPGVTPLVDDGGTQAQHFNALTSGQTVLYNAEGRLLFSGGITGSRGHSGDNAGRSAVESLVNVGAAERAETLVFGCPLFGQDSACQGSRDESNKH